MARIRTLGKQRKKNSFKLMINKTEKKNYSTNFTLRKIFFIQEISWHQPATTCWLIVDTHQYCLKYLHIFVIHFQFRLKSMCIFAQKDKINIGRMLKSLGKNFRAVVRILLNAATWFQKYDFTIYAYLCLTHLH